MRQIKTSLYRYEDIVNWNPADYNDPGGYYMTWQYCCRNGIIDNIKNPSLTGQTFYLEFPALSQNGKVFLNSSPIFGQIDGEFLCVGDPFWFSFDAKDADGDELRYSFATPLDRLDPNVSVGSQNGLDVQWISGFSADKAIPGTPPLTINRQTGELTVTPTQLGLFVFTVVVEEYRNGQKIGLVRRDYQLLVVDCPPTSPPDPTITINNQPATTAQICEGASVEMKAITNSNWAYQWKKDGSSIPGATSPVLTATESGTYQLTTSLKNQCSKSRRSNEVKLTVTKQHFKLKSPNPLRICGPSGSVELEALSGVGLTYQWYFNGKLLPENTFTLIANQPGPYWAVVRDTNQGCTSFSDTIQLTRTALPVASISPQRSTTAICSSDSLVLTTPYQLNYRYQWSFNGTSLSGVTTNMLVVHQAGQYTVTVTDSTTCQLASPPFTLAVVPSVTVTIDSIPKQCGFLGNSILLKGSPSGGFFAGPGVSDDKFEPIKAGVGHHTLTYTIKSDLSCQQGTAQQVAIVSAPSVVISPARSVTEICAGDSLQLTAQTSLNAVIYSYKWLLDNIPLSGKETITAKQAGTYQVSIVDTDGCQAQSQTYSLMITPTIHVRMDSVPAFCGSDHSPITLQGYPANGVFSGPGVTGNQYDPRIAGIGTHLLKYTVNSSFACQNGTTQRLGLIQSPPVVDLGPDVEIWRGSSIQLHSGSQGTYQYQWTPPTGLSNSASSDPTCTPEQTSSYTLTVTDNLGCSATDNIVITVYERIWIPDAFSPNGDGMNENWELRGIESYPLAEVTIFNRWGEIIFFSKQYKQPFDGTWKNSPLPTGAYIYQIKPSPSQAVLQGSVFILK
ncbi:gliding motility-associated C-terminal domain-containing protein [Spirosoma litoris]